MQLIVVPHPDLPLNVWMAAWRVFVQPERFAEMHIAYMALAEESAREAMAAPAEGRRPHQSTDAGKRLATLGSAAMLRRATMRTLGLASLACLAALLTAGTLGHVQPSLPIDGAKALQTVGGTFALWGTLLAVDGPPRTGSGATAVERVHAALFTWILTAGASLALVGTLVAS